MIRTLSTGFLLLYTLSLFSQNEMKEINRIKSNINYLYAIGTSSASAEGAANNAKDLIALEIEQWLKENSSDDVAGYVAKSKESLSQIKTKRGNFYRVFVYVKKIDVLPYYKEEEVMVVDFVEPQKTEKIDTIPVGGSLETKDSSSVSTINNAIEKGDTIVINHVQEPEIAFLPTEREKKLITLHTFSELNDYISQGRESNEILKAGKYKDLPTTGQYYIFIYNRDGNIPAYIKKNDNKLINMVTGKDEAITTYKGCGAIWIQLKEE